MSATASPNDTRETTVNRPLSARFGPAAGAAGAALYAVSAFTAGTALKPDASLSQVVAHLTSKREALLVGVLLATIAVGFLFWFLGYLRAFLGEAEGGGAPLANVTLVAWVALIVIAVAGAAPLSVVTWHGAGGVDPQIVRLSFNASNLSLYSLSASAAILSVLAPIIVIWRSKALPRWLVGLGIVEIGVNVIELAGIFTRTGSNAGGYALGLGPFVWVLWVSAVSVAMTVKACTRSTAVHGEAGNDLEVALPAGARVDERR